MITTPIPGRVTRSSPNLLISYMFGGLWAAGRKAWDPLQAAPNVTPDG